MDSRPNTRQRKSNLSNSGTASDIEKENNFPPKRSKELRDVKPPLYFTPWRKFIYTVSISAFLIATFYAWRLTQWKTQAGGWFNLMLGRHPDAPAPMAKDFSSGTTSSSSVGANAPLEDRLRDLAEELGIHPRALASAIRPLMPAASVTSVGQANPTGTGLAVSVLADDDHAEEPSSGAGHAAIEGLKAIIGMDDGPVDFAE